MEIQEKYISMEMSDVDACYLKSLEILAMATKGINRPNRDYWIFAKIEKAINHYEKKVLEK